MGLSCIFFGQLESTFLARFNPEVTALLMIFELFALHLLLAAEVRALNASELAMELVVLKLLPWNLLKTPDGLVRTIYLNLYQLAKDKWMYLGRLHVG